MEMNFGWIPPGVAIDASLHGSSGAAVFLAKMNGLRPWSLKHRSNAWPASHELRFNALVLPACGVAALAAGAQMQLERFLGIVDQFTVRSLYQ